MQQAIFRGAVETLVVWNLDRILRDMRDGINLLADWRTQGLKQGEIATGLKDRPLSSDHPI